jgi:ketosteroid isomerase-like protein
MPFDFAVVVNHRFYRGDLTRVRRMSRNVPMIVQKWTRLVCLMAALAGLCWGAAHAQSNEDAAAVVAANQAFYAALSALDLTAMEKIWAHDPDVLYIGPFHRKMVIGWPAVQTEFVANKANVAEISVKPLDMHVRVNGDTALVFGREEGAALPRVGISASGSNFVTNVFKKEDGRWRMVAHHAQRIPQ